MKYLSNIVHHPYFDKFIISLIVINGVTLGLETSESLLTRFESFFHIFDIFVVSAFALEAFMKILVYRVSYFKNGWNLFDFTIVVISLLPTSGPLQILRIFRVFRLLRLITIIPSMRKIVSALLGVIPGILSVSALVGLIFYIYSIMTTQLYGKDFPEWFGTIGDSFYTLFQIMTLESWSMGIVRPVMEVHPYAWIVFVSFILIATFVMINLVIAIVVEAMNKISDNEEDIIIEKISESENATKNDIKKLEDRIKGLEKLLQKHYKKK
ncbi:ion transporter [Candidatus Gracilibacteria bacterium]|nr:ion transporter [Candidatus Gracilibacteria bacterium]